MSDTSPRTEPGRIVATSIGAALVAAVLLFTAVLPAEFGFDPLGTGRLLGLVGLSRDTTSTLASQSERFISDEIRFVLAPFESVEYKYRIERGASMLYSWRATGEVLYDMHSEPDGAEPGYAETFDRGRSDHGNGTYVAPFPGIHGWFWENRGSDDVSLVLTSAGFYSGAMEFRDGKAVEVSLTK